MPDKPQSSLTYLEYPECGKRFGADPVPVDGLLSDAGRSAAEAVRKQGWFDGSTFGEPNRLQGNKTMGLELAQHFSLDLPDVILYPNGSGTGLIGLWKTFDEMENWVGSGRNALAWSAFKPQAVHRSCGLMTTGTERTEFWQNDETLAAGLRVPAPFADRRILRSLREGHGAVVAVIDEEIGLAQKELACVEGVVVAPEGAAAWAALKSPVRTGWIQPDERQVLVNPGIGLKYL